jgi:D-alanyl-lipoteichoic acid acyltransferase DltB (MBOAT superfamily)
MLFNSYTFILLFLPITLLGVAVLGQGQSARLVVGWLIACSVAFYGIWNPLSLAIILPSLCINYGLGRWMAARLEGAEPDERGASVLMWLGIAFNLCFLGYFKYKNFLLDTSNWAFGTNWPLSPLLLPLGISFITFQKIAFLVDIRAGTIRDFSAFDFLIFVFFFPQLVAGPIVHYREMVPQFQRHSGKLDSNHLAIGLSLFAMGLFKKAVLADGIAPHANTVFTGAEQGDAMNLVGAWMGALAYTLQIYFDFSGYSDMAVGLARMFGIRLPANFNSPLKASSIIEFWSRWHLTLTRFLTAYVYTPLVMQLTRARMAAGKPVLSRTGKSAAAFGALVAFPTVVTMALSGIWHGAGMTFILWGLVHGLYLVINHAWRMWRPAWDKRRYEQVMKPLGLCLTLLAVVAAMVLFRAKTLPAAWAMLQAMAGMDGVSLPQALLNRLGGVAEALMHWGVQADVSSGTAFVQAWAWILVLGWMALALPNSLEVLARFEPALHIQKSRQPARMELALNGRWALAVGLLLAGGVLSLNRISEFLYWQF